MVSAVEPSPAAAVSAAHHTRPSLPIPPHCHADQREAFHGEASSPRWTVNSCMTGRVPLLLVHQLLALALLPVLPEEALDAEDRERVDGNGDALADHRPVEPPVAAIAEVIDEEQLGIDGDVDPDVSAKPLQLFHPAPGTLVAGLVRALRAHGGTSPRLPPRQARSRLGSYVVPRPASHPGQSVAPHGCKIVTVQFETN